MNKKQNEIIEFLSKFKSCNEEQLIFFTNCTKHDINYLLTEKLILKDKDTRLLYKSKEFKTSRDQNNRRLPRKVSYNLYRNLKITRYRRIYC